MPALAAVWVLVGVGVGSGTEGEGRGRGLDNLLVDVVLGLDWVGGLVMNDWGIMTRYCRWR